MIVRSTASILCITALSLAMLSQCNQSAEKETSTTLEKYQYMQPLMGTRFSITLYAADKNQADAAAKEAFEFAYQVNRACSDYDVTSELMKLNAAPARQPITVSPTLLDVLREALSISQKTNGAYDPTLGQHSYNWRMARKKSQLPASDDVTAAKAASGWKKIQLDMENSTVTKLVANLRLDLGGIAKGYTADKMLALLEKHNITRASIIAGGEVRLGDPPPKKDGWKVSLKTLDTDHSLTPSSLTLSNCAVSTSGDLHQSIIINGTRYSHVVDPATGLGLTRRISATIIGPNATLTDALATAYCVNPELSFPDIRTIIVFEKQDGTLALIEKGE